MKQIVVPIIEDLTSSIPLLARQMIVDNDRENSIAIILNRFEDRVAATGNILVAERGDNLIVIHSRSIVVIAPNDILGKDAIDVLLETIECTWLSVQGSQILSQALDVAHHTVCLCSDARNQSIEAVEAGCVLHSRPTNNLAVFHRANLGARALVNTVHNVANHHTNAVRHNLGIFDLGHTTLSGKRGSKGLEALEIKDL
mmetsp:Transcript_3109/g.8961  ORF Transcript_3109/g.8961 Transcript_3109/m.8961 type:complete len:200 (+) Transcript_3109:135-734(+)